MKLKSVIITLSLVLAGLLGSTALVSPGAASPPPVGALFASQLAKLSDPYGWPKDYFGAAVSVDGDLAVVGAYGAGKAYVFDRNQGGADQWGQVWPVGGASNEDFGQSVSVSGNLAVAGAPEATVGANLGQGAAYLLAPSPDPDQPGVWWSINKLTAADGVEGDGLGNAVQLDGDTLVIGANLASPAGYRQGTAYVFARNQGGADNWGQVKKLTASDGAEGDLFGSSVAVSGDVILVGAYGATGAGGPAQGAAYVFAHNQGGTDNWGQLDKLTASDGALMDEFGAGVALDGDTALVGAWLADLPYGLDMGAAYVYRLIANAHPAYVPVLMAP